MTRSAAPRRTTRATKKALAPKPAKKAAVKVTKVTKAAATKQIKKAVAKATKTAKKDAKTTKGGKKDTNKPKLLELGLLCDCTSSMWSWIDRAKKTLQDIISNVVSSTEGLEVRVSFVGYRDHCDTQRFSIQPFTNDIAQVKNFIANVSASGGGDLPEDVVGGLRKCLDLKWTPGSLRQVFLICDAPCHGRQYHVGYSGDDYPDGSPEGLVLEPLMREFKDNNTSFTVIKLQSNCDKMIAAMKANHPELQVTDLENATRTKSAEEVTKMFVDSASYILRAKVGGKAGGKASAGGKRTTVKAGKTLWDPKQLKVKDVFSCISYLKVLKIEGNHITVQNQLGGQWFISKDILEREMWSADHFEKEVKCNMTDLSEIIEQCSDTIFKVQFKKKVDPKNIEAQLSALKHSSLKNTD